MVYIFTKMRMLYVLFFTFIAVASNASEPQLTGDLPRLTFIPLLKIPPHLLPEARAAVAHNSTKTPETMKKPQPKNRGGLLRYSPVITNITCAR